MIFKKRSRLIIILIFFVLGVFFSLSTYSEKFSILFFYNNKSSFLTYQDTELLKGEKLIGEIIAKENNLGIVSVKFNTYGRINNDSVIFRIKQKNTNVWYYKNEYKVDQFQPNDFFTFGFPVINDSKGKTYLFEIESVSGKKGNAIGLSTAEPVLITKYQFASAKYSPTFAIKKLINSFFDTGFIVHSTSYFLPLGFYILFLLLNFRFFSERYILLILNFLLIFLDIFDFVNLHDNGALVFFTLGFLIMQFKYYKIESKILFFIAFLLLLLSPLFLFFNRAIMAERLTIWTILLLLTALVTEIIDIKAFFPRFKI